MNIKADFGIIFVVCLGLAVVLKFKSIVCLRLALEEYQNLNDNKWYFLFALVASTAPNALMAPMYTYDHDNCMPTNFLITQRFSGLMSAITFLFICSCAVFFILMPNTFTRWTCCMRGDEKKTGQVNP